MEKKVFAIIAVALIALDSCTSKSEDGTMTVEERRELLSQSDDRILADKVFNVIDRVQPYLSEPLTKEEYRQVADSIISLDKPLMAIEDIDHDVTLILNVRKKGQFFDETEAVLDVEFDENTRAEWEVRIRYTRTLSPDGQTEADNFNRKWANIARQDSINRHLL